MAGGRRIEASIMKKIINILLVLLVSVTTLFGQKGRSQSRIHAAKMAYIADKLNMSKSQYVDFVPVYGQYEREISDMRQSFMNKYKNTNPKKADDATSRQFIDDNLDYQEAVIEIKRKYNERFLKVLSPQQLAELGRAEREFKQLLMQRLRERRGVGRFR